MSYYGAVRSIPDQSNSISSSEVQLEVRQHPQNALVTPENKEKTRKPIDPPPIVQLKVLGDKHRNWLVNPFLFMNAVLVGVDGETHPKSLHGNQLLGQNVSSLHRLKDINNKDGGFFVFGDISCRKTGMYRLQFNLFNYESQEVNFLTSVTSNPFRVMTAKEYPGLQESTHLSRTFSDQGVRLRLRKENRNAGVKRTYTAASEVSEIAESRTNANVYGGGPVHSYSYDAPDRGYIKRQRSDSEYASPHSYPTYSSGTMQQYGMPSNSAYAQHQTQPQPDAQPHMGSLMAPIQQGVMPSWQRSQAPYSAPITAMGMSGGSYFSSGAPATKSMNYAQQTSPQYGARGSTELYGSLNNLPTPVSEQSLGSTQSSFGGYGQPAPLSATLSSRGPPVQPYDLSHLSSQYPPQPGHYGPTSPQYHTSSSNVAYDQHSQPPQSTIKMQGQPYGDSPNIYNAPPPPQHAYSEAESFTSTDLPLSSGMLNREYPGAYQQQPPPPQGQETGAYGELSEQDVAAYHHAKSQQPAGYPTPHQPSPTQLRDHG